MKKAVLITGVFLTATAIFFGVLIKDAGIPIEAGFCAEILQEIAGALAVIIVLVGAAIALRKIIDVVKNNFVVNVTIKRR